ncbi:MAG: enolase-phosphatase E1, partial [Phenylobacterium sp.]
MSKPAKANSEPNKAIKVVLCDIEGTTTDIKFVHQVLFPFARQQLSAYVQQHQHQDEVAVIIAEVKTHLPSNNASHGTDKATLTQVIDLLIQWIDEDKKAKPLKTLQGLIWQGGYHSGELKGHIYPDVLPVLQQWHADGIILGIYSSGSVAAQKLLFSHSDFGDLTPLMSHYFDTVVGHKQQTDAYRNITQALALPAESILFLSDVVQELDA